MLVRTALVLMIAVQTSATLAFEKSGSYWPEGQATFNVGIPGFSPSGESWNSAFKRAMEAWTTNTTFSFIALDQLADPCSGQDTSALGDGIGGVGFASSQCGTAFGANVLAITLNTLTCLNATCTGLKEYTESDIIFNSAISWDIYSGPEQQQTTDFERVALHELGHALGLDHEFTSDAIMQPFAGDLNSLQQDDINGANAIYGGASSISSIYGIPVQLPAQSIIDSISETLNLDGSLASGDALFEEKFLDLYQVTLTKDSNVNVALSSPIFDASLIVARIASTQQVVPGQQFADDNSGNGSGAQLNLDLQAGTYWFGATSANSSELGNYSLTLDVTRTGTSSTFESFTSIYGVDVEINPNGQISGSLSVADDKFEDRYLDIYQFDVTEAVELRIDLDSTQFDTRLLLVDVLENQEFGSVFLENDDNGSGTNSTVQAELQPGTYWMVITTFENGNTGEYDLAVTVVLP